MFGKMVKVLMIKCGRSEMKLKARDVSKFVDVESDVMSSRKYG
jgi:riboflavin synthase alpha subunit